MITIHNLEVAFDVEGDSDREAFARLFQECIEAWSMQAEEQRQRDMESIDERSLVAPSTGVGR